MSANLSFRLIQFCFLSVVCSTKWKNLKGTNQIFSFVFVKVADSEMVCFGFSSGGLLAYADSQSDASSPIEECPKKRVLVLGTGWAGTSFLKDLDASKYDVQVVSPQNYFSFTPLLPSVTCGTVEARSIVEPVRNIMKKVICVICSI